MAAGRLVQFDAWLETAGQVETHVLPKDTCEKINHDR